jgi:hypothetical protein
VDSANGTAGKKGKVTLTYTAVFYTLTVTPAGTGTGTVTSNPSGINCGATCAYNFGQTNQVTLSANASDGSAFAGWSGSGCSGTGTCVVTMNSALGVTATFNLIPTGGIGLLLGGD